MDLIGLVKELERQRANSLDLIVEDSALKAAPDEAEGIRLKILGRGEYPLTDWAHGQLADKLEIPRSYYERMRSLGKREPLAENINAWLQGERRLIRILDGKIRAILSDRYRIIDNYDLVFLALEEFKRKKQLRFFRIDLTETMLYLKAIDRTLTEEIRAEDVVLDRLILRNSEVGASALRIELFILRKVCSNSLILQYSLKKIHLGRQTLEINEINWSDEARELDDRALWSKVIDIIEQHLIRRSLRHGLKE